MITILVFRTNIKYLKEVKTLKNDLESIKGITKWSFDLDDCDKVLRVTGISVNAQEIISLLNQNDFTCLELN